MNKNALIVFVKNGSNVKTRIAKETNEETAINIYKELVNHCINICTAFTSIDVLVYYSPEIIKNDGWETVAQDKFLQVNGDLGIKMNAAFEQTLKKYDKAIIIGSDCPYITKDTINIAFEVLSKSDVVIGPAVDGGYYLLGLKSVEPALFEKIPWSTNSVFYDTIDVLFAKKKSIQILERLKDIDLYDDYLEWKKE